MHIVAKIFNILSNIIHKCKIYKRIICPDHVGFIPDKSIHVIYHLSKLKKNPMIISINARKKNFTNSKIHS